MSVIRPLARVPPLLLGESFVSYVERLAAMHQVDLLVMLKAVGLITNERYETINGYGVVLSETQLERFSIATKMKREQVSAMLLSSYDGTALNMSGVTSGDAGALRKLALAEWAFFSGTHVCPHCVRENFGAWQLAWKLPWSFACVKHKCYLVGYCPGCDRRFNGGRRDRRLSPVFVRHVPTLGRCNNPRLPGESSIGKAAKSCGHLITDIPIQTAGRSTLAAQKQINRVLAGISQTTLGISASPREFIQDLRSLCALVLYCAEASDLAPLAEFEYQHFSSFADRRDAVHAERSESALPRKSGRVRVFIGPQEDPGLMAAVIGYALKILELPDQESAGELLRPIAERAIARTSKARWTIMNSFRFSERLSPAFQLSLAHRSTFDRTVGNRSLLAKGSQYTFESRHVPQLIWEADFDAKFSKFFPDMGKSYARRFCAMSLVKLCGDYTWGDTAILLGLPERAAIKLANKCVGLLAEERTKRKFSHSLHTVAKRLSAAENKIDYGRRREFFAELDDIQRERWLEICHKAGITPGQPGRRSKYAATWLWSYLTDGDWTLAPALHGEDTTNGREVFRTMMKGVLLDCRNALIDYGVSLLTNLENCDSFVVTPMPEEGC